MSKVWAIHRGSELIGIYSSKPSIEFLKGLLKKHYDYLTDSGLKDLLDKGWTSDGWVDWTIIETEVEAI